MIHARNDYQRLQDPEKKIPQDEPVFLLRAQDQTSAEVVRHWCRLNKRLLKKMADGPEKESLKKGISLAEAHAYRMDDWPTKKIATV